ncbi:MAG: hypothetical protein ACREOF_15035 [Gemmatimonadales bacterium]
MVIPRSVQGPPPPPPQTPPTPPEIIIQDTSFWAGLPPHVVFLIVVTALVAGGVVLWPIVRALARWIDGRADRRLGIRVDVARLPAKVAELEAIQPRLAELEERLDFTERMLARSPAGQPLRPGDQ